MSQLDFCAHRDGYTFRDIQSFYICINLVFMSIRCFVLAQLIRTQEEKIIARRTKGFMERGKINSDHYLSIYYNL